MKEEDEKVLCTPPDEGPFADEETKNPLKTSKIMSCIMV
jgi:hypothetical protein